MFPHVSSLFCWFLCGYLEYLIVLWVYCFGVRYKPALVIKTASPIYPFSSNMVAEAWLDHHVVDREDVADHQVEKMKSRRSRDEKWLSKSQERRELVRSRMTLFESSASMRWPETTKDSRSVELITSLQKRSAIEVEVVAGESALVVVIEVDEKRSESDCERDVGHWSQKFVKSFCSGK